MNSRHRQAVQFAGAVANSGYAPCRCVWESPIAREYVADAETGLCALLLAWETGGGTWADVEDAERTLAAAWQEAAERYELLDGSHPYSERSAR